MKEYTEPELNLIAIEASDAVSLGNDNSVVFDPNHLINDQCAEQTIIDIVN